MSKSIPPLVPSAARCALGFGYSPLQIIWSWVFVLTVRAERADITRRVVHKAMPDHLILSFESHSPFSAGTTFHRAIVRSIRGVNICMGAKTN